MKHSIKHLSDTRIELHVSADEKDLQAIKQRSLNTLATKLKVPGFRKGKVPASVAEKHLDAATLATQVAEDAANAYVAESFTKEQIQPLERPEVNVTKYVPGSLLEFTAEADILPAITLGEYKGLKAKRKEPKPDQAEVDKVLDNMRRGQSKKAEVDRAAKDGDEVWIDFDGKDKDGAAVPNASGKDYPLTIGSSTFIPGFEEGLVGKKKDDSFELPLTFPKDYGHKALAGAKVTFAVTVKKINEVTLPELDDAFAAQHGEFKNMSELTEDIKSELANRALQEADETYKNDLLEELLGKCTVPAPEVLVKDQMKSIERDTQQNLLYRGLTVEAYLEEQGLTHEQWETKELRPGAEKRVQIGLLLAELSKAEKIEVTQGELNAQLKAMLEQYPQMREQLQTPEARRDIANRTLTEKTMNRLVELNQPKPKKKAE